MERNSHKLLSIILSGIVHVYNFVTTWLIPPRHVVRQPFPLIDAVRRGDAAEVQSLLAHGADPNVRETQVAMRQGFWRTVIQVPENLARTPLILAASEGNKEIVQLLLDEGAGINATFGFGVTALEAAIGGDSKEAIVQLLIERGANVNACGFDTPLIAAAAGNKRRLLQLLLDNGADINGRDDERFTALMEPAGSGHAEIVQDLIAAGIDVNAKNNEGFTALDYAREHRQAAVVALLAEAGAR